MEGWSCLSNPQMFSCVHWTSKRFQTREIAKENGKISKNGPNIELTYLPGRFDMPAHPLQCSLVFLWFLCACKRMKNAWNREKRGGNDWKWAKKCINLSFWRVGHVIPPPPVFCSVPQASKYVWTHEKSLKLRKVSNKCLKKSKYHTIVGGWTCQTTPSVP